MQFQLLSAGIILLKGFRPEVGFKLPDSGVSRARGAAIELQAREVRMGTLPTREAMARLVVSAQRSALAGRDGAASLAAVA